MSGYLEITISLSGYFENTVLVHYVVVLVTDFFVPITIRMTSFLSYLFQRELESPTPKRQRLSGTDSFEGPSPNSLTPSPSRRRSCPNRWPPSDLCLTPRSFHHRNSQFLHHHLPYHHHNSRRSPPHLRRSIRHRDKNGELSEVRYKLCFFSIPLIGLKDWFKRLV